MEHMIVVKTMLMKDDRGSEVVPQYRLLIDPKVTPMKDVIIELKRQKYKQQLDAHDILETDFFEQGPQKLGITLNILAECKKAAHITMINRRVFKVTCYFVGNALKNLKLKTPSPAAERLFDWQFIYIDAETRTSTKSFVMAVTENDIREIVRLLIERQHAGEQLLKDEKEILNTQVSQRRLLEFILDAIVIDENK